MGPTVDQSFINGDLPFLFFRFRFTRRKSGYPENATIFLQAIFNDIYSLLVQQVETMFEHHEILLMRVTLHFDELVFVVKSEPSSLTYLAFV